MEEHPPEKVPREKTDVTPVEKRYRPNSAQLLIDLGPLLAPVAMPMPRMRAVTYLDLHSQLTAEQVRAKMMHLEEATRCAIQCAYYQRTLDFAARLERLQRWMLHVEDRTCRLALGARNQLLSCTCLYPCTAYKYL